MSKKIVQTVTKLKNTKQLQMKLFSKQIVNNPQPVKIKSRSKKFNISGCNMNMQTKPSTHKWSYGTGKTPNELFISSWNVNGIRSVMKKQELPKYVALAKPDIICLNQTKIDQVAFDKSNIQLQGYHSYWNFCKCSTGYSGVGIFSKYLPISLVQDIPQKHHSQQGRVLTMEFQKFYLVAAYIPNSGAGLVRLDYRVNQYDKCFQSHCQQIRKKKPTIVCGDLNVCHQPIDIARPESNQNSACFTIQQRNSFGQFLQKGWVDTFRALHPKQVKYTYWSVRTGARAGNVGWRLDYFLVNKQAYKFVKQSRINNDVYGSDHCPIQLVIDFTE